MNCNALMNVIFRGGGNKGHCLCRRLISNSSSIIIIILVYDLWYANPELNVTFKQCIVLNSVLEM